MPSPTSRSTRSSIPRTWTSARRRATPAAPTSPSTSRRSRGIPLLTAAEETALGRRVQAGDEARQAADGRGQSPAGRADRPPLPQPRPGAARPDRGGQHRAAAGRREVRARARRALLDLRDLVDPPGGDSRARQPGADDPAAGPRRAAAGPLRPRAHAPHAGARAAAHAGRAGQGARDQRGPGGGAGGAAPAAAVARPAPRRRRSCRVSSDIIPDDLRRSRDRPDAAVSRARRPGGSVRRPGAQRAHGAAPPLRAGRRRAGDAGGDRPAAWATAASASARSRPPGCASCARCWARAGSTPAISSSRRRRGQPA